MLRGGVYWCKAVLASSQFQNSLLMRMQYPILVYAVSLSSYIVNIKIHLSSMLLAYVCLSVVCFSFHVFSIPFVLFYCVRLQYLVHQCCLCVHSNSKCATLTLLAALLATHLQFNSFTLGYVCLAQFISA